MPELWFECEDCGGTGSVLEWCCCSQWYEDCSTCGGLGGFVAVDGKLVAAECGQEVV
jgi:hypothetical protein